MVLRNSFERALSDERLALAHRQKMDMQVLKSSQRQGLREWMAHEKKAREEFFQSTESGNAKAQWMKDRKHRYAKLRRDQDAELGRLRKEQDAQRRALAKDQDERRNRFETALRSGFVPASELWPAKGK